MSSAPAMRIRRPSSIPSSSPTVCPVPLSDGLTALLEEHVVASLLKQARLEPLLAGASSWSIDLDAGVLTIGEHRFAPDVLGSESRSGAFLWAWANPTLPAEHAASAKAVFRAGRERGVPELTHAQVETQLLDAQVAGLVASGIADADAAWTGDAGEAGVAVLLRDAALRAQPLPLEALPRIVAVVAETELPIDPARALRALAARPPHGLTAEADGDDLVVTAGGTSVRVGFDEQGRVAALGLRAGPGADAPSPDAG